MNSFTLSYSFSRQNARAEKKDINVRTRHDATLEDLKELIQPLEAVRDGINPKTAPGYITAACDSQYSTVKDPETGELKKARRNFFYRCDASVSKSSLAYLDIDNATPEQYAAAVQMVKRSRKAMCIYTTASHTDEAPRFRVVMPMARPVGRDDIVRVRYGLLEHFFKGYNVDASGFTLSQPMYLPPVNSMVTWSRRDTLIEPEELLEGIPEMKASTMSDYVVPEGEKSPLTDLFEEFAFEYGGVMTERGLKIPATPEHAENYSDPTPRPDDFLLCWPRDGYKVPNITMIHDTDITATSGMTGRQKWEYVCEATGLPFDERFEAALGWGKRDAVEVSEEDLEDEPEAAALATPDFIVEGFMPSGCLFSVVAASGAYKSFYMLAMMAISAAGYRFAKADTRKAHHFYIDGEGGESTYTRIEALAKLYGEGIKDYIHVIDAAAVKADPKAITKIVRETVGDGLVGMIVYDTLNQTLALGIDMFDENSASTTNGMGKIVAVMKEVRQMTGASVGVVHHTGRNGGHARGSTALYAGVDVEILIEKVSMFKINMYHGKYKNGVAVGKIGMELQSVQFKEAPPPKVYQAVEFTGVIPSGVEKGIEIPVSHEAPVLLPFGYEPWDAPDASDDDEAQAISDTCYQIIKASPDGITTGEIVDKLKERMPEAKTPATNLPRFIKGKLKRYIDDEAIILVETRGKPDQYFPGCKPSDDLGLE